MKIVKGITLNSEDFALQYWTEQLQRHDDPDRWRGLPFGHPDLDHITGGVRRKEFIIVAGAQKSGKTTSAVHWSLQFANKVQPGESVLFVSLEMSHTGIGGRVFSNLASIDVVKFRDYKLEGDDWDVFEDSAKRLGEMPIYWNVGAYNLPGITSIVEDTEGIRVVVVDYFQLMMGDKKDGKRWEQLEALSRELKQLAVSKDMSVVVISQQTREALKSIAKQRDPNTMAGTQALARDADMMLILLPLEKDGEEVPHMREIYVALSRNSVADVGVDSIFIPKFARIGAPTPDDILEMPLSQHELAWEAS